jgi:acetate kinase
MTSDAIDPPGTAGPLHVLALNSGSSSLKFGLYAAQPAQVRCMFSGEAERIGHGSSAFQAADATGRTVCSETAALATPHAVVARVARLLADLGAPAVQAIGHRVVHGGPALRRHCRIDDTVLQQLQAAQPFAPLHTPAVLAVVRSARALFPALPQVACFDTVFHAHMPAQASVLPLPALLRAQGIQRYGFHGLSCESIVRQLAQAPTQAPPAPPPRLLIAHLGNGASITAVRDGVSIDTSMGLTPSGGLIMGTRSGDLDPGVLVYLAREKGFDAAMLEDLVDHRSGLAGISGLGGDMRALHAAANATEADADAALAIDMFCYTVRKQLAAMWAALGGADTIVFTGGIGEHDATVRSEVCRGLQCFGVQLDAARHRALADPISSAGSSCRVQVLPSQEDEQIARHTAALVGGA